MRSIRKGGAGDNTVKAILNGIHHLLERAENLVVVTNRSLFRRHHLRSGDRKYLEKLGAINCQMAQIADTVTEGCLRNSGFHKKTGEERKMKKFYHSFLIAFSMYSRRFRCPSVNGMKKIGICHVLSHGSVLPSAGNLAVGTFGTYLGLSSAFYTVILTLIPWLLTGGSTWTVVGYGRCDEFMAGT